MPIEIMLLPFTDQLSSNNSALIAYVFVSFICFSIWTEQLCPKLLGDVLESLTEGINK